MPKKLKVACVQLNTSANIEDNKSRLTTLINNHNDANIDLYLFPECALYRAGSGSHKEPIDGDIVSWFKDLAIKQKSHILIGSFFEESLGEKGYNTSVMINPQGEIIQTYRKMNLFDVNVDDSEMQESKRFLAGNSPKTASIDDFKFGLSICYDLRFPELFRHYVKAGCNVLCVPSSFTRSTGKLHWHALLRARAIENQCYVLAPNQFGLGANDVDTYGHSLIIDPLGNILAEGSDDSEDIITAELDLKKLTMIRKRFPVLSGI